MAITISQGSAIREITTSWVDTLGNTAVKHFLWAPTLNPGSDTALGTLLTSVDNLSQAALRTTTENIKGISSGQKASPTNPPNVPISTIFYMVFVSNGLNQAGHTVEREIPIYAPVASALLANGEIDVTNTDVVAIIGTGNNMPYQVGSLLGQPAYNNGMTFSASRSAEVTQARIVSH